MRTPWGKSDSKINVVRGVSWVGTPSHGGFAVTPTAALQYLSTSAVSRATKYGSYYFFEEDCDYAIVMLEMHEVFKGLDVITFPINVPTKETLIESLSRWHADYLLEIGVQPTEAGLKLFNENKQQDRMRADRSPDLIIAAFGEWAPWVEKGTVGVTTADGSRWLIPAEDYDNKANLNLLSNYPRVKAVS